MKQLKHLIGVDSTVDHVVSAIEHAIVIFAGFSALLVMFVNIMGRYFFSYSLVWAEEYTRYCLIILVYLGASIAVRRRQMLKVEILANIFPKLRTVTEYVEVVSGIGIMSILFVLGCQYVQFCSRFNERSATLKWLPMWVVYAILPVSAVFIIFRYIQYAIDLAQPKEEKEEK